MTIPSAPPTTTFPVFTEATLDGKVPTGPIEQKWDHTRFEMKLINPSNRRKFKIIIVGSGLAGASAAATLGEAGYNVECYCYQDSPRRAHSCGRPGRHQRRQELPQRRRQRLSSLLRYGQGRRLPRTRGQCLPPGRGQQRHHRPMCRPRRTFCPGIRRHARQPLFWRRTGCAHLLRTWPDRTAAFAGRLSGPVPARLRPRR